MTIELTLQEKYEDLCICHNAKCQEITELKSHIERLLHVSKEMKEDLLMRGSKDEDGCVVVEASFGRWLMFTKAIDETPKQSLAKHDAEVLNNFAQLLGPPDHNQTEQFLLGVEYSRTCAFNLANRLEKG